MTSRLPNDQPCAGPLNRHIGCPVRLATGSTFRGKYLGKKEVPGAEINTVLLRRPPAPGTPSFKRGKKRKSPKRKHFFKP
ncbi:hypothetical protein FKM82_026055 [Ascaphus truei]